MVLLYSEQGFLQSGIRALLADEAAENADLVSLGAEPTEYDPIDSVMLSLNAISDTLDMDPRISVGLEEIQAATKIVRGGAEF